MQGLDPLPPPLFAEKYGEHRYGQKSARKCRKRQGRARKGFTLQEGQGRGGKLLKRVERGGTCLKSLPLGALVSGTSRFRGHAILSLPPNIYEAEEEQKGEANNIIGGLPGRKCP